MKAWKFAVEPGRPLEIPAGLIREAGLEGEVQAVVTFDGIYLKRVNAGERDEEFYKAISSEFGGFIYG